MMYIWNFLIILVLVKTCSKKIKILWTSLRVLSHLVRFPGLNLSLIAPKHTSTLASEPYQSSQEQYPRQPLRWTRVRFVGSEDRVHIIQMIRTLMSMKPRHKPKVLA